MRAGPAEEATHIFHSGPSNGSCHVNDVISVLFRLLALIVILLHCLHDQVVCNRLCDVCILLSPTGTPCCLISRQTGIQAKSLPEHSGSRNRLRKKPSQSQLASAYLNPMQLLRHGIFLQLAYRSRLWMPPD